MDINRSVEEAKIRDISLLDVRTPEEYRHGHIPGAINIPLNTTSKVQLDPEKSILLIVIADDDQSSLQGS